jgi:hypothetical protein
LTPDVTQNAPTTPTATPTPGAQPVEFASPPSNFDEMLDAEHDNDAPVRFRKLDMMSVLFPNNYRVNLHILLTLAGAVHNPRS